MLNLLIGQVFFYQNKLIQKCSALYDFCRVADNIADNVMGRLNIKER